MRNAMLAVIILSPIIGICLTLTLRSRLAAFRTTTPFIEKQRDLAAFAAIASMAMYGSIVQLALLFVPLIVYLLGIVQGEFSLVAVLFVVIPSGAYLLFYVRYKRLEEEIRSMRIDNQEILKEFIFIVDTWKKQSLPKW